MTIDYRKEDRLPHYLDNEPLPIEIRPGKHVWIAGIPHDLTVDEAAKIAAVVRALAHEFGDEPVIPLTDYERQIAEETVGRTIARRR